MVYQMLVVADESSDSDDNEETDTESSDDEDDDDLHHLKSDDDCDFLNANQKKFIRKIKFAVASQIREAFGEMQVITKQMHWKIIENIYIIFISPLIDTLNTHTHISYRYTHMLTPTHTSDKRCWIRFKITSSTKRMLLLRSTSRNTKGNEHVWQSVSIHSYSYMHACLHGTYMHSFILVHACLHDTYMHAFTLIHARIHGT